MRLQNVSHFVQATVSNHCFNKLLQKIKLRKPFIYLPNSVNPERCWTKVNKCLHFIEFFGSIWRRHLRQYWNPDYKDEASSWMAYLSYLYNGKPYIGDTILILNLGPQHQEPQTPLYIIRHDLDLFYLSIFSCCPAQRINSLRPSDTYMRQ